MKISVIGTGYVGLSTATVFAELGNDVIATDVDESKINNLNNGIMPIFEPGLKELVDRNMQEKRLRFTTNNPEAVEHAEVIFICVGTPPKDNWEIELKFVESVAKEIAQNMNSYKVIVHKSTVPVETGEQVKKIIKDNIKQNIGFDVVSNPEFLREGSAVNDTLNPNRIVIGSDSKRAVEIMKRLYEPIKAPFIVTDIKSAEIIKHASNAFLATKISFINSVAQLCELSGANIEKVAEGMGYDRRIARDFLNAGIGYGGSCFPKDAQAFIKIAEKYGVDYKLLKATHEINEQQKKLFVKKVKTALNVTDEKQIGVLGLSFKPDTDDMRFAPSIYIINSLLESGAKIKVYDPKAMEKAEKIFKNVEFCTDTYEAANNSDALLILTEWSEFRKMDLERVKSLLKNPLIIDGRNLFNPEEMEKKGFKYLSVGR
jgi:UDPglucose 6-dehydrogenase